MWYFPSLKLWFTAIGLAPNVHFFSPKCACIYGCNHAMQTSLQGRIMNGLKKKLWKKWITMIDSIVQDFF